METRRIARQALAALTGLVISSALAPLSDGSAQVSQRSAGELIGSIFGPAAVFAQTLVEGKGKVIAVTQEKQELVLEHGEIKGFMEAMTMGYKVNSPSLLKGLKAGDQVQFTIDKNKSVITKISKVKKS